MIVRGALFSLVVLALAGCDSMVSPSYYGLVEVEAVSRDSEPVPGVRVVLYTGARHMGYGTTDDAGRVRFERIPAGAYGVVADPGGDWVVAAVNGSAGTDPYAGVLVHPESTAVVRYVLADARSGVLTVRVVDDADVPLVGAAVTLYTPWNILATVGTDATGLARFDGLEVGPYGVIVRPAAASQVTPAETYADGLTIAAAGDSVGITVPFARQAP